MQKYAVLLAVIVYSFTLAAGEIVINEGYGGGGNSGAPFNQDFVELFNNGAGSADISGFQLEYSRPGRPLRTIATIPASTVLGAGEFYIIGGARGVIGAALPRVHFTTFANVNSTAGRVELLDSSSSLADLVDSSMTATRGDDPHHRTSLRLQIAGIFLPSDTMSDQRIPNGLDTNDSNLDFLAQLPTPIAVNVAAVPEPSTWRERQPESIRERVFAFTRY